MSDFEEIPPHWPEHLAPLELKRFSQIDLESRFQARIDMTRSCESPIEIELGIALVTIAEGRLLIRPQHRLGKYRYDFLIAAPDGRPLLLVECDGREFHRTLEQIRNDGDKDALARSCGLHVHRVTGAEIYRSVNFEARRIVDLCLRGMRP